MTAKKIPEIIDLSQEIYDRMPVYKKLPEVKIEVHATHEEWQNLPSNNKTPSVLKLQMGEHTGTHVDALSHMGIPYKTHSIDKMPLNTFLTSAFCLDFSHKELGELIEPEELIEACKTSKNRIQEGDTVLIRTDHYKKHFGSASWAKGPGLSAKATRWLGEQKIAAFGVETMSPGVTGISNKEVHTICGEMGFTHYENLINLDLLTSRTRFQFIGLPLKIRGGTGSPVRAVAVFY